MLDLSRLTEQIVGNGSGGCYSYRGVNLGRNDHKITKDSGQSYVDGSWCTNGEVDICVGAGIVYGECQKTVRGGSVLIDGKHNNILPWSSLDMHCCITLPQDHADKDSETV